MARNIYGAIEAGGTKFVCEVADGNGAILEEFRIPTTTPDETLDAVLDFFTQQERQFGSYTAFGIAAFGPLNLRKESSSYGRILGTPKPGWSHTDLVSPLAQRFDCPVTIDTDVNAAALAEALHGAGRGCDMVVYVTVGTGIGGGIWHRGDTVQGSLHPEMGHIRVLRHALDPEFAGICPFHGDCLEGMASGASIMARYGDSLDRLPDDHEACRVVGWYLGQLAVNAILLLSPQRAIFGGGVMANARLYDEIRGTASELLNGYAGLGGSASNLEELIVAPGLGARSGIAGALALAHGKMQ